MAGTIAKATAGRVLHLGSVIWARAEGCRVTLTDGRELLDLTGGFGVAALGHRNPRILEAWREQEVVHALGDLADAEVTVRLREALPRPAKLGVTGEDAVEIALAHRPARDRAARHRRLRGRLPRHRAARARGDGIRAVPRPFAAVAARARAPPRRTARIPGRCRRTRLRDRRAGAGEGGLAGAAGRLPRRCCAGVATRRGLFCSSTRSTAGSGASGRSGRAVMSRTCSASGRRSAAGCRSRPRSSTATGSRSSGSSGPRTSTRTRMSATRSRAPPRSSCSRRCRGSSAACARRGALRAGGLARRGPPARPRGRRGGRARARRARRPRGARRVADPGDAAAHDHRGRARRGVREAPASARFAAPRRWQSVSGSGVSSRHEPPGCAVPGARGRHGRNDGRGGRHGRSAREDRVRGRPRAQPERRDLPPRSRRTSRRSQQEPDGRLSPDRLAEREARRLQEQPRREGRALHRPDRRHGPEARVALLPVRDRHPGRAKRARVVAGQQAAARGAAERYLGERAPHWARRRRWNRLEPGRRRAGLGVERRRDPYRLACRPATLEDGRAGIRLVGDRPAGQSPRRPRRPRSTTTTESGWPASPARTLPGRPTGRSSRP